MDGVGAEFAACCADCVTPASCFQGSLGLQVASVHRLQVMGVSASGCVLLDFGVDGMGVADWADIAGGLRGELAASLGRWSWPSWQRSSGIQLNHAECLSYLALRSLVSSVVSGAPTSPALWPSCWPSGSLRPGVLVLLPVLGSLWVLLGVSLVLQLVHRASSVLLTSAFVGLSDNTCMGCRDGLCPGECVSCDVVGGGPSWGLMGSVGSVGRCEVLQGRYGLRVLGLVGQSSL